MRKHAALFYLFAVMVSCKQTGEPGQNNTDATTTNSTAMENVLIFDEAFYMPQLDKNRRIWIYLPAGYDDNDRHYPVMYMHDGQNLFDDDTSFAGEWGVDESLNQMFEEGYPGFIVVGVDNGSEERLNEYSPWVHDDWGGGQGGEYVDFLVNTLKPMIDSSFRTLPGRENTGIGGSSMGGLISMYATLKYPEVFSRALIFSPAFWFADDCYQMARKTPLDQDFRFYFLAGGKEYGETDVPVSTKLMVDILIENGLKEHQYEFIVDPKGKHNEAFWEKYFPAAARFLFAL